MLDRSHRLTTSAGFTRVTRRGRRAGGSTLVLHYLDAEPRVGDVQVGFVVSKAVGAAVVRNRVRRRLRHLMRERLRVLASCSSVVVRALPPAAGATTATLRHDLDAGLRRLGLSTGGAGS